MGSSSRIYRYIGKEFLFSFFVCFIFFFFIFFVNQILFLAEKILEKHVPFKDVVMLLVYFMPSMISLSFPFAALVACLMTVGRLSSDNEILAMQALGIRHIKIFYPLIVLGVVFSISSFYINDYLMPYGTIKYTKLYRELIYSNPALELVPYSVKEYLDTVIVTGDIKDNVIHDIMILDKDKDGNQRVITADTAQFLSDVKGAGTGVISLELRNVFSHVSDQKKRSDYDYFTAQRMEYNILLANMSSSVRTLGPREMSTVDVYDRLKKMDDDFQADKASQLSFMGPSIVQAVSDWFFATATDDQTALEDNIRSQLNAYGDVYYEKNNDRNYKIHKLEFYKKFSLPFSCLCFVLFAFPAGLFSKRSGRTVGFGIGLLFSLFYWCMMFAGHTIGIKSDINSFMAMWIPNFVILLIALVLYIVRFVRR